MTTQRLDFGKESPDAYQAMMNLEEASQSFGLDFTVRHLIKLRTSQINGCAFCIDMHARDMREHGEAEHRIWALNAWRETPFFDEREQAALAIAEAMAGLAGGHGVSDAVYDEAARVFSTDELLGVLWTATAHRPVASPDSSSRRLSRASEIDMSDLDVVTDVYAARNRARFRSSPAPGVPSSRSCSLAGRLKASDFG